MAATWDDLTYTWDDLVALWDDTADHTVPAESTQTAGGSGKRAPTFFQITRARQLAEDDEMLVLASTHL